MHAMAFFHFAFFELNFVICLQRRSKTTTTGKHELCIRSKSKRINNNNNNDCMCVHRNFHSRNRQIVRSTIQSEFCAREREGEREKISPKYIANAGWLDGRKVKKETIVLWLFSLSLSLLFIFLLLSKRLYQDIAPIKYRETHSDSQTHTIRNLLCENVPSFAFKSAYEEKNTQ